MLIGFDFSAAFAFADRGAYFPLWSESPPDIRALWALVERLAGGDPHLESGAFLAHREARRHFRHARSEEHTSELQSLMRISYAVFCLKQKTHNAPIEQRS